MKAADRRCFGNGEKNMALKNKCWDAYEFRILKDADFDEVWNFARKYFVAKEPIMSTLALSDEEAFNIVGVSIKTACNQEVSLGVYDKEIKKLIAVRLSLLGKRLETHRLQVPVDFPLKSRQCLEVACSQGVSLGAFDKKTGKVVAVRLSTLGRLCDDHVVEVPEKLPLKSRQGRQVLENC